MLSLETKVRFVFEHVSEPVLALSAILPESREYLDEPGPKNREEVGRHSLSEGGQGVVLLGIVEGQAVLHVHARRGQLAHIA